MQMLARAGEDFPFFSRLGPPRATPGSPSPPSEEAEQTLTPGLAPLEFVSKATSAIRSASSRARRALVELKDDIIDFGGSQQQALSQGPGWALPWAAKTELERQREEIRRRLRELSQEPFRFLVPPLELREQTPGEATCFFLEGEMAAAAAETALEDDPCLKALKDEVVPRMLSETEFWHRYFAAVRAVELEVLHNFEIAARLSDAVPAASSSGESIAFLWLGGRRTGGVSPVRPFDVDGEGGGAEGCDGLMDARRSVSEQGGEALCQRNEAAAPRCSCAAASSCEPPSEGSRSGLLEDCTCSQGQSVGESGRSLTQPFGSFIEFGAPGGDGVAASLARQLSSVSAEQPALPPMGVAADVKGAAEGGGPARWIRRTVSGIGAMSGLGLGDTSEAQHNEIMEAQAPKPCQEPQSCPSTAGGPAPVEQEQGVEPSGKGGAEPAFLAARDSLPCSSALQHLSSACASATAFKSCVELLAAGCDASPSYAWPAFSPLSAVGDALRHSISGQQGQSPPRNGTPTASSSPGDEPPLASKGLRLPLQEAIIAALFCPRPVKENEAKPSLDAASPAQGFGSPGAKSPGRARAGLTRTLHGAPAGSFVADLALAMASLSSVQEMAQMWLDIVEALRECFRSGKLIPGVPLESEHPDLQMCEVMQHLQLLNLCVRRRERRASRLAADCTTGEPSENSLEFVCLPGSCAERPPLAPLHVQVSNKLAHVPGEPAPSCTGRCSFSSDTTGAGSPLIVSRRRGVKELAPGLVLLGTGEALCIPETQDTPLMTETSVRESEELIISTGSMGSGCKQLFSDMQAFKAANPGCLLEDFVRWYSPPDWSPTPYNSSLSRPASEEEEPGAREDDPVLVGMEEVRQAVAGSGRGSHGQQSGDETCTAAAHASLGPAGVESRRGCSGLGFLSPRMVFAGNLWQELWDRAEAIPSMDQPPLYDVEEGGRNSLAWLQDLAPAELLEQLFVSLVAIGLGTACDLPEASREPLRTSLGECVRYATAACCRGMGPAKQQWVCTVYRVMEAARAAANAGTLPGVSQETLLPSALTPLSVTQRGRVSADMKASSSPEHGRCGPQPAGQELPYPSLQEGVTEGHMQRGLVVCAAEEASAAPAPPVFSDAQRSGQGCSSSGGPSSNNKDEAPSTPPEDPPPLPADSLPPPAAEAPCEERREDPSTGIRQAAAAIFSKLRAGPGWSRPSVSWPNLEGAAAPFRAAEPVPSLAPLEGAGAGAGGTPASGGNVYGPEHAPERCSSETRTGGREEGTEGVAVAGEGVSVSQLMESQAGDKLAAGSAATMGQLASSSVASSVTSGLPPKEKVLKDCEGEWVII